MSESRIDFSKTYDVIIVGAGPAGCVLASRLSEEPSRQILLIEAGPDVVPGEEPSDLIDPYALTAFYNTAFHWPDLTAETGVDPGNGAARATLPYAQGYGVGGASNINGMGADRGQPGDYDHWGQLGAAGWSWDEVLPYFKKLERELDFSGPDAAAMHGYAGPMPVRRLPRSRWAPFTAAIGDALQRRGFPFLKDYMTDFRDGFGSAPTNCLPERRMPASIAYLTREVRRRSNLKILTHARVERIGLEGKRANGVFVHADGVTKLVSGRQVIVSCGALQSPALLMRSGIGPGEHLAKHGIEVVRDLRGVGANLGNHACVSLTTHLPSEAQQPADNLWFLQNWMRYSSNHPGCAPSDMHLMAFNKVAWHALGARVGLLVISVLGTYSRGRVELSSADPGALPKVRFNLLDDKRDYDRLVDGLRFSLQLLADPEVKKMRPLLFIPDDRRVASLNRRTAWNRFKAWAIASMLDCTPLRRVLLAKWRIDAEKLLSDEKALRSFVEKYAHLQFHVCGTCRMGRADDPDAVVDGAGKVHGIEALRVVDASIFPTVPRGYTHFIVLMAAEKIADAIKAEGPVQVFV